MRPVGPWLANPRTEIGTSIVRGRSGASLGWAALVVAADWGLAAAFRPGSSARGPPSPAPCAPALLQGRVGKIDRRHLPDRRLPEGASDRERGSSFVPGWLGVCTADDEPWSDDYRWVCSWSVVPAVWAPPLGQAHDACMPSSAARGTCRPAPLFPPPARSGQYSVVIYDSSAATKQAISCGATKFDTVEEAVRA